MSESLIPISIEPLEEGGYLATSPVLQGLIAQGRTIAETLEIAENVALKIVESCIEHGDPIPKGTLRAVIQQAERCQRPATLCAKEKHLKIPHETYSAHFVTV